MNSKKIIHFMLVWSFGWVTLGGNIQGAIINLANDFQGPNFSYGIETSLGGSFTPFSIVDTTSRPGITALLASGSFPGNPPYVAHNSTGAPYNLGFLTLPPDTLDLHPGPTGEFTVVRFSNASGSYSISGLFSGLDNTTTDVHILLDGVSIFNGNVNGLGNMASFSLIRMLAVTDTLDFAVGFGSDGNFGFDSTGLSGTLSSAQTVPEPGTCVLLGGGLLLLSNLRRRRNR